MKAETEFLEVKGIMSPSDLNLHGEHSPSDLNLHGEHSPSDLNLHGEHSPSIDLKSILSDDMSIYKDFWCTLSEYLQVFPQNTTRRAIQKSIKQGKLPKYVIGVKKVIKNGCIDSYLLRIDPLNAIYAYSILQNKNKERGDLYEVCVKFPSTIENAGKLVFDSAACMKFCDYVLANHNIGFDTSIFTGHFSVIKVRLTFACSEYVKKVSEVSGIGFGSIISLYFDAFWKSLPTEITNQLKREGI
jgi:hypothetical protein